MWKPLASGLALALLTASLFRIAGPAFFFEGRAAANIQALAGAGAGLACGWAAARAWGLRGVILAAIPGLLLMAAIASHFNLAYPALDPKLDKGFGGLMLWFHGFMLIGGVLAARLATRRKETE